MVLAASFQLTLLKYTLESPRVGLVLAGPTRGGHRKTILSPLEMSLLYLQVMGLGV